ncbi:LysR family transcriptional regulator [Psychroflexus sp. YR1-1]|uniref:LysR family transcriptional regulator n=1 Tax=Psychroflexus aurantiacus TaxID=2709310 RepID=A0A6B3R4U8_9FLAO|nr:LysR family transcriptional regulator [Psychroflexus aurantiacus]NEV93975.1 LysR family transcriptional regulator [Psychroflexus aurantiacus]
MNYTLHQLLIFSEIANSKSITRTAEKLHLTQPAVSIQLRNFQDQFSIPLTEVVGRQLFVTDFGNEIAEAARKILEEVDAINYKSNAFKGKLSGRIQISVASTGKYVMPYFFSEFMDKHAGVDLIMDVTNKTKVIRSMEKNEVDFALISVLPKKLKVRSLELMQNQLFLVAGPHLTQDQLARKEQLLSELPLIFREEGSATRKAMEGYISKHNLKVKKKMELTSNEAVKQAVMAGLGISIMPLIGIKNELREKELQIVPVSDLPLSSTWQVVWLKSKKQTPVAKAFLDHLELEKDKIAKEHFSWIETYN